MCHWRYCYRSLTVIALASLLAFSHGVSPLALEKTATREVDQASTDLNTDMKVNAFTAAIQAAVNSLIARVNAFDGRITTLETWKPTVDAAILDLQNRVGSLETRMSAAESSITWLINSMWPYVNGQINSLTSRVTTLEGGGKGTIVFSGCHVTANQGTGIAACGTGEVMASLYHNGLTTGAKQWYSQQTCCKISIQ
jgi:hypothetical protein